MRDQTVPHKQTGVRLKGLRVEVLSGPDKGQQTGAREETITVGTAPGNDLVVTDPTVSRYHLELRRSEDRILVQDLRSTNGTLAGGIRIESAAIPPGTVLKLGRTTLAVDDGDPVTLEFHEDDRLGPLVGRSPSMRGLMARIERGAHSDASVLVLGETGCGKELIARAIHEESVRRDAPFETVDCGALMPTLVASELFGHEKGAFTGADRTHVGAFERANGGTIFLDEIGELPSALQTALLGVLERKSFRRVGGQQPIAVDVRVVAATHRDLRAEVNKGSFRQDLYYRLAVILLRVPPLRERTSDIPLLVEHFLREAGHDGEVSAVVPDAVMRSLGEYHWPGNVRELRNFVESALALGEPPSLDEEPAGGDRHSFPSVPLTELYRQPYKDARARVLAEFEQGYLQALLERSGGNVSQAARDSGINRTYLTQMLKRHPIRGRDED